MNNEDYHSIIVCLRRKSRLHSLHLLFIISYFAFIISGFTSCDGHHEHIAPAVRDQDSLPFLTAHGISNLISDSGVISYKIVAEDWNIYTTEPQKWTFLKGLFLEKFDTTFHVEWHVQSDTAYCHANRIWELRGRVVILNRDGDLFETEELFWDMDAHQMWNTMFITITKPKDDQQLQGYNFRSNEEMTDYRIENSAGYMPTKEETNSYPDNSYQSSPEGDADNAEQYSRRPSQADNYRNR